MDVAAVAQKILASCRLNLRPNRRAGRSRSGLIPAASPAANRPRHAREFETWLADGAAGEMEWLARGAEKRGDPQKVLPGARSVIVVAMNYWQGKRKPDAETGDRKGWTHRALRVGR